MNKVRKSEYFVCDWQDVPSAGSSPHFNLAEAIPEWAQQQRMPEDVGNAELLWRLPDPPVVVARQGRQYANPFSGWVMVGTLDDRGEVIAVGPLRPMDKPAVFEPWRVGAGLHPSRLAWVAGLIVCGAVAAVMLAAVALTSIP
jgi:hypothetical protein